MNKYIALSFVLLVSAFFIYVGAYYYQQQYYRYDLRYSKIISEVTSTLHAKKIEPEPVMSSAGYAITEQRGILISYIFSIFLLMISIGVVIFSKINNGYNRQHLPLLFSSVLLIISIIYTTYVTGMFGYA